MSPRAFNPCSAAAKRGNDLRNHVLQLLERTNLDNIPGRLGLEDRLFLCEGIDALTLFGRRLVLDDDLAKTRNRKGLRTAAADTFLR